MNVYAAVGVTGLFFACFTLHCQLSSSSSATFGRSMFGLYMHCCQWHVLSGGEGNNVFGLLFDATRSWCYALIHSLRNLLHALDATLWNILHGTCYTFLMLRFETLQTNRHCHVVDTRFSENRPSKIHRCLQKLLTLFWMTTPAQNQLSLHLWIKGTDVYGNYA